MKDQHRTILLVEDNEDDVFIFRRAFTRSGIMDHLQLVTDGEEAVAYLAGRDAYAVRERFPLPYLVILDLKLPRRSGLDVLRWMRSEGQFAQLPVIVLTSSAEARDLLRTRELGALHYLVKPPTPSVLSELIEMHRAGFGVVAATDGARPTGDRFAQSLAL